MICIIDYGSGNIGALVNVFKQARISHFVTSDARELAKGDRFLLPGVGAFDPTMEQLHRSGFVSALNDEVIQKGKRALGICVGMHLLAEGSDEGESPGLGWIKGRVRKIDTSGLTQPPYLPHLGWNSVEVVDGKSLFEGVDRERGFYFLHSYYFDAAHEEDVSAYVDYGRRFACGVERDNVIGMQFHPEKSHRNGMQLLNNFANLP